MAPLSIEEIKKLFDQSDGLRMTPEQENRAVELMALHQGNQRAFPPRMTVGGAPPTTGSEYPGNISPPVSGTPPFVPPGGPANTPNFLQRLAQSPIAQSIQNIDPAQFMELLKGTGGNLPIAALGSFQAAQKKAARDKKIVDIQEKYGKLLSDPNLTPERRKAIGVEAAFELARYAPSEKAMENIFEAFSKLTGFKESDAQARLDAISNRPVNVPEGSTLVDPKTGKVIATGARKVGTPTKPKTPEEQKNLDLRNKNLERQLNKEGVLEFFKNLDTLEEKAAKGVKLTKNEQFELDWRRRTALRFKGTTSTENPLMADPDYQAALQAAQGKR